MRKSIPSIRRLYGLLLNLFPRNYRHEYGEELQAVFALSLADAAKFGNMEIAKVLLRELVSFPQAVFFEHLRERRKNRMTKKIGSHFSETIAVFIPFLVVLVLFFSMGAIQYIPARVVEIIRLSLIGILLVIFAVGLTRRLPRWVLPFIGFVFAFANLFIYLFIFEEIVDPKWRGFSFPPFVSQFVVDFVQTGTFWVGIIILVFLFVVFSALIPVFRPFYQRLRNDWTLLAFILYGITPFAILITFDDYHHAGPYVFVSFLILALGGWLYLHNNVSWKKFMFLFLGLTLAMVVTVIGAVVLFEDSVYASFSTWQTSMAETITTWMWLAVFMLLPPLINLLPQPHITSQSTAPS
ncbi:MAG: hypothetical protein JW963_13125 [Anaerolineales bacterium]|nr:hypothetical protein [Anaerolineales bacterium]